MPRIATLLVLLGCTAALAACGGSTLQATAHVSLHSARRASTPHLHGTWVPPRWLGRIIAREERRYGDTGHPGALSIHFGKRRVSVETFGEFTAWSPCGSAYCPASTQAHGTVLRMTIDRRAHRLVSVVLGHEIDHSQAVQIARRSNGYLRIFSSTPGIVRCSIPGGGMRPRSAGGIPGRCVTEYAAALPSTAGRAIRIRFAERWRLGRHVFRGGWIVTVAYRNGRVLSTQLDGSTPPQLWK